jgi:glycolate oxidase
MLNAYKTMLPDRTPRDLSSQQRSDLIAGLLRIVPADLVLSDSEALHPYECDGLSVYRQTPLAVILPKTVSQAQTILKYCHQKAIPVVARGAGTGLSGGAYPLEDGILLSLAKFNRILHVDVENHLATVEPGVRNLAISKAVAPHGLFYAPDPSSQIACSIGGNVAENSGGVHCLKYGLTVHNVRQLKILTIEGELITLGSEAYDTPGYDLLALMHGSEGMLGVIVEVTVLLQKQPEKREVLLASFSTIEQAGNAVAEIISTGIIPAGLEMMDKLAIEAAEAFAQAGYPTDAEAILLCELDGSNEDVATQLEHIQPLLKNQGADDLRIAENDDERSQIWAGRKSAFPAVGRISPDYYCMDGTIPRRYIGTVLQAITMMSQKYGLAVANVFHAGDGNLHPLILYDANQPGELEKAERFGAEILELSVQMGGTITGEHGVGIEKIDQMCVQFKSDELEQFHRIKAAFDPQGLLNPGKGVPSLHRCAEFGAMHVHGGELPFPELPRF